MERQTFTGEIQWIVVDDGQESTEATKGQIVVRPQPRWQPGQITLARNILAALPLAIHDKIVFIEDDDWYGPEYLARMAEALDHGCQIVGDVPARYYHVGSRLFREIGNRAHASLCQTGIRGDLISVLEELCDREEKFLDIGLFRSGHQPYFIRSEQSVGIKGLPGRRGIGIGHRPSGAQWKPDPNLAVLRSWIGSDAALYEQFAEAVAA
jgi:glycosyltransferase involved in cell wall biosynthesis